VTALAGQRVVVVGGASGMGLATVFLMTNRQVTGTVLEVTGGETLINTLE
jgi:NAD(P)-dependent dehydrogenase (short-subunit alcohol dehydrogenase family)